MNDAMKNYRVVNEGVNVKVVLMNSQDETTDNLPTADLKD